MDLSTININGVLDTLDIELPLYLQQSTYKNMDMVKDIANGILIKIIRKMHKIDDTEFKENFKVTINIDNNGLDIKTDNLYSTILILGRYKPYTEISYLDRIQFEDGLVIGYNDNGMFVIAPKKVEDGN